MNGAFSFSSLFLVLFLLIFPRIRSASDIVQDTCKKIAANDKQLNFDFCVKSLGSDPESGEVDLEGLGLIGLRMLRANLTSITEYTKQLLKQKLEPRLLKSLSRCLNFYAAVEGKDMTQIYKAKSYAAVRSWASGVATDEDSCDTQLSQKKGMVPPLTNRNAVVFQLSLILLGILNIF